LDAGIDTISFSGVSIAADRDTVYNFTVGNDILGLDVDYTTAGTSAGENAAVFKAVAPATNGNGFSL
jgi:hypothetical protein